MDNMMTSLACHSPLITFSVFPIIESLLVCLADCPKAFSVTLHLE